MKLKRVTDKDFKENKSPLKTITIKNYDHVFHGRIYESMEEIPSSVRESMKIYEYIDTETDTPMHFATFFDIDTDEEWFVYHSFKEADRLLEECRASFFVEVDKLNRVYSDLFGSEYDISISVAFTTEEKPHIKID